MGRNLIKLLLILLFNFNLLSAKVTEQTISKIRTPYKKLIVRFIQIKWI